MGLFLISYRILDRTSMRMQWVGYDEDPEILAGFWYRNPVGLFLKSCRILGGISVGFSVGIL